MPVEMIKKKKRTKSVKVLFIPENDPAYDMLEHLVKEHHEHLENARIALVWMLAVKPDADAILSLGKCKKASDLDRELKEYDFVITLNREAWTEFSVKQRLALLDHELCHARVAIDDNGEPKVDERGRTVYRIRKHDIEEFREIIERHGCYKADLEHFAGAIARRYKLPMFETEEEDE